MFEKELMQSQLGGIFFVTCLLNVIEFGPCSAVATAHCHSCTPSISIDTRLCSFLQLVDGEFIRSTAASKSWQLILKEDILNLPA